METTPIRRPRFDRQVRPNFQITDRDTEIIRQVAKHRLLNSAHIIALLGSSSQVASRRLNLLYHHHYLDRPRAQLDYYTRGGSQPMVYALGNRGADFLAEKFGLARGKVDWFKKNQTLGRLFIRHTLGVAEFMIRLELACRRIDRVRLIETDEMLAGASPRTQARRNPCAWKVGFSAQGQRQSIGLIPDRIFGLHFTDKPEGGNEYWFFLEIDRATMPVIRRNLRQTSFYKKMRGYFESRQAWKRDPHVRPFPITNFRVLTVTTTQERIHNLIAANKAFYQGQGSKIFLFTDQAACLSGNILTLPWQSGTGDQVRLID